MSYSTAIWQVNPKGMWEFGWSFNHCDELILGRVIYTKIKPQHVWIHRLATASGSQMDYIYRNQKMLLRKKSSVRILCEKDSQMERRFKRPEQSKKLRGPLLS